MRHGDAAQCSLVCLVVVISFGRVMCLNRGIVSMCFIFSVCARKLLLMSNASVGIVMLLYWEFRVGIVMEWVTEVFFVFALVICVRFFYLHVL